MTLRAVANIGGVRLECYDEHYDPRDPKALDFTHVQLEQGDCGDTDLTPVLSEEAGEACRLALRMAAAEAIEEQRETKQAARRG